MYTSIVILIISYNKFSEELHVDRIGLYRTIHQKKKKYILDVSEVPSITPGNFYIYITELKFHIVSRT